jgi:hypothetical protein
LKPSHARRPESSEKDIRIFLRKPGNAWIPLAALVRARDAGHALFRPDRGEIAAQRLDVVVNLGASLVRLRRDAAIGPGLVREIDEVIVGVEAAAKVEPGADDALRRRHQGSEKRELRIRPALDGGVQSDLGGRLLRRGRLSRAAKHRAHQIRPEIPSTSMIHGIHPGDRFSSFTEYKTIKTTRNLLRRRREGSTGLSGCG